MKQILLTTILLASLSGFAQEKRKFTAADIPRKDGQIFYEVVDTLSGYNKDQIYSAAKLALIKAFKDAKEVIQEDDKQNGKLIGKGLSTDFFGNGILGMPGRYRSWFIVDMSIKDNKYRLQLYSFDVEYWSDADKYSIGRWRPANFEETAKLIDKKKWAAKTGFAFHTNNWETIESIQDLVRQNLKKDNSEW